MDWSHDHLVKRTGDFKDAFAHKHKRITLGSPWKDVRATTGDAGGEQGKERNA